MLVQHETTRTDDKARRGKKKGREKEKKCVADLVGRQNCHTADLAATAGRNPGSRGSRRGTKCRRQTATHVVPHAHTHTHTLPKWHYSHTTPSTPHSHNARSLSSLTRPRCSPRVFNVRGQRRAVKKSEVGSKRLLPSPLSAESIRANQWEAQPPPHPLPWWTSHHHGRRLEHTRKGPS